MALDPRKAQLKFAVLKRLKEHPQAIWSFSPKDRQLILKKLGYNVPQDGKSGPRTAAAAWGFTQGLSADLVNKQGSGWANTIWKQYFASKNGGPDSLSAKQTDYQSRATPIPQSTPPLSQGSPAQSFDTGQADPEGILAAASSGGGDYTAKMNQVLAQAMAQLGKSGVKSADIVNPAKFKSGLTSSKYAQNLSDTKYGAVLDNLNRQLALAPKQTAQNARDIGSWFDQADSVHNAGAQANAETLAAQLAGVDSAGKGFISAIGGSADLSSPEIGSAAMLARAGLQGQGQAQSDFDHNMASVMQAQRAQELLNNQRSGAATLNDLQAQLAQQLAEKSAFQATTQADATQQDLGNYLDASKTRFDQLNQLNQNQWNKLLGIQNLILGASQLPAQQTSANLANANSAAQLAGQIALNAQQRAQLQQFQDTYSSGHGASFNALDHGTRAKLAAQLMTGLTGPKGKLAVNPKQFLNTVSNRLYNVAGYQRTPQTDSYVKSLLEPGLVSWWNKYHPNQAYTG